MKHLTVKQTQQFDRWASERMGVPSVCLMENAGKNAAEEIVKILRRRKGNRAIIVCGLGNNAGDGFVIGRHLINAGVKAQTVMAGSAKKLKGDALINYNILRKLKLPVKEIKRVTPPAEKEIAQADVVVDAMFGTGLNRNVGEPFKSVIEAINTHAKYVVAVDIPSGLNGDTGEVFGVCVKANVTVTFVAAKQGFRKKQGPKHTGRVIVRDIGIK